MKRFGVFVSVLLILLTTSIQYSSAVFGRSQCEKVKKSIVDEQNIGLALWRDYDTQRDNFVQSSNSTNSQLVEIFRKLQLVYNSDQLIYDQMNKFKSCFNVDDMKRARTESESMSRDKPLISSIIAGLGKKNSGILDAETRNLGIKLVVNTYKDFYSWNGSKKLS